MIEKIKLLLAITVIAVQFSYGQGSIKFNPGFGFGFFYPKDVNDYIESLYNNAYMTYGTTDIFMNFYASLGIIKEFEGDIALKVSGEIAFAPKIISVTNGEGSGFYSLNRLSPMVCIDKYFPVADNSALFIGLGAHLNYLQFKSWNAITPGGHLELGYRLSFDDYDVEAFVAGDYINGKADSNMSLNYTGIRAGAYVAFGFSE